MMVFNRKHFLWPLVLAAAISWPLFAGEAASARVWEEDVVIPTYLAGPPDLNPMFYFGRAYQGAEGRVYPYPLYDKITGRKADKTYRIVYLENEYVKIGIMPELGGRVFSAVDKTDNYNFFYHQHVIKPALIGMLGIWISGGVEWNIPHHHRATSLLPVQYHLAESPDGSRTVWVGELELRHRMRWTVGYTLRPGKSYLETSVRIFNRTPLVNTFLCFANVAVHANENYQVIFPPRTPFVTQHSKREFTTWPIATTRYGGSDFTGGVDVSWYKNHALSNSMFAWNYEDDFLAGYDHGIQAGTLSVADHHIVPGKKFWTWGSGPEGRLWDHILSDEDGPYLELMVGAYSDNQPDYSWIQPYEVKAFKQFWYPFRDIGGVKNATLDAAVNLEVTKDGAANIGFCTTSAYPEAVVQFKSGDQMLLRETVDISPGKPYRRRVALPRNTQEKNLRASISVGGCELVAYSPVPTDPEPVPIPVQSPPSPQDIKTIEELYLAGQRIDQFHNPALEPEPYWEEALRRDSLESRVNTSLGIRCLKQGRFEEAERYLRKALVRITSNYTTPKDGEPFYYLGFALKAQDRNDDAFDAFYKAAWSAAWQAAAYASLAEIACLRGDWTTAFDFVNRSLNANALNVRALNLKSAVLRHLERSEEALKAASAAREADPLDVRAMAEVWLAGNRPEDGREMRAAFRDHPATGLETAAEYGNAGLWQDGSAVLMQAIEGAPDRSRVSPMVYYYLGFFADRMRQDKEALEYYRLAAAMPPDYVFPFQWEVIRVLRKAMEANPGDAYAPYYLGNLLHDWQPAEAVKWWERSNSLDSSLCIVHRNLAVAYSRQENGLDKAIASMEKAVSLGDPYAIHFFELDQLYEAAGASPEKRLAMLEKHHAVVSQRDDALSREISLMVNMGKCDGAIALMTGRQFDVWEGGARFSVHDIWTDAHLLLGRRQMAAKRYREALAEYREALEFPANLQTARTRSSSRNPEVAYWIGAAYEALGDPPKARGFWRESSANLPQTGSDDVLPPTDGSVLLYYKALSLRKLGQKEKAEVLFQSLVRSGEKALQQNPTVDFFAKFGEQQSQRSRLAMAHYLAGLGYLGLNDKEKTKQELNLSLQASPDHLGAKTALAEIN